MKVLISLYGVFVFFVVLAVGIGATSRVDFALGLTVAFLVIFGWDRIEELYK